VAIRLIKHRPVPGRAWADLLRDLLKFPALVRHRTMPGRAPYVARTGTVGIVRYTFLTKSYGARHFTLVDYVTYDHLMFAAFSARTCRYKIKLFQISMHLCTRYTYILEF